MSEPPVPAGFSDPLLAEAVALLSKEVLKLETEKADLENLNLAEVKEPAGDDFAGELQPQSIVADSMAVKGLDPFAPAFHPVDFHQGRKRSKSGQPRSGSLSRRSSKRIASRDPVLEDVMRRLEEEVARIKLEEKPELSPEIQLAESVVEVDISGDQSKGAKVESCEESDHYIPTHDPVLDDIVEKLEREVAETREREVEEIKEREVEFKKEEKVVGIKEGIVAEIKERKVAEGKVVGVEVKEGVVKGDPSSLEGGSKGDGAGGKLEQEYDCLCLRSMKLILCRECGGNFQGRLSRTCSAHPRAAYLHDVRACIYCLHTDLGKLQEFDLPANKELVAPPGNLKNGQGTPIVEV